eukprot:13488151-Alexandrium_andersonii.AAC.1
MAERVLCGTWNSPTLRDPQLQGPAFSKEVVDDACTVHRVPNEPSSESNGSDRFRGPPAEP